MGRGNYWGYDRVTENVSGDICIEVWAEYCDGRCVYKYGEGLGVAWPFDVCGTLLDESNCGTALCAIGLVAFGVLTVVRLWEVDFGDNLFLAGALVSLGTLRVLMQSEWTSIRNRIMILIGS